MKKRILDTEDARPLGSTIGQAMERVGLPTTATAPTTTGAPEDAVDMLNFVDTIPQTSKSSSSSSSSSTSTTTKAAVIAHDMQQPVHFLSPVCFGQAMQQHVKTVAYPTVTTTADRVSQDSGSRAFDAQLSTSAATTEQQQRQQQQQQQQQQMPQYTSSFQHTSPDIITSTINMSCLDLSCRVSGTSTQ